MPRLYLNILETEKMLQFGTKNSRRAVIPAQEVKENLLKLKGENYLKVLSVHASQ